MRMYLLICIKESLVNTQARYSMPIIFCKQVPCLIGLLACGAK